VPTIGGHAGCASAFALRAPADSKPAVARAASVGGSLRPLSPPYGNNIKNGGGLASPAVGSPGAFRRYAGSTATISSVSGSMITISSRTMKYLKPRNCGTIRTTSGGSTTTWTLRGTRVPTETEKST